MWSCVLAHAGYASRWVATMRKEDFDQIKANMKARKITGTYIAFQTSRSVSQINDVLRGNYPWYQGYGLPKYLYEWLVANKLLEPTKEGYLTMRAAGNKKRKPRPDKYDPRDVAILGGDPSL